MFLDTNLQKRPVTGSQNSQRTTTDSELACVLVADNDADTRNTMTSYLNEHGLHAISASGRQEMARHFVESDPMLVILDLQLDRENGLNVVREIRSQSDILLIATSQRRNLIERVIGLELGADDYLVKPIGLRELLARVRAVLRRATSRTTPQLETGRGRYRFGGWELSQRTRQLTDPKGSSVSLTKGEYALLTAFLDTPQQSLSRAHLVQVTRMHEDISARTIDGQILRLRRKLEGEPGMPRIIRTERGVGYAFALPVERQR